MILRLEEIAEFVKSNILPFCNKHQIFTFTGPIGAGKTTLIQEILRQLGITKSVTSPTFGYIKIYKTAQNTPLYHFDLYRLEALDAFLAAGFDEYLTQENSLSFIEWPSVINQLLTSPTLARSTINISLQYTETTDKERLITIDRP